jgi:hypothetical protein
MKLAMLLALAACQSAGGGDDFPTGGGGGGGPIGVGGGGGDAGTGDGGDGDAGTQLSGRVCILSDLRRVGDLTACAATKANGLVVSIGPLGTRTAITAADGSFTITAPLGGDFTWHVSTPTGTPPGTPIVTSVMPFGADYTIPAISDAVYMELLSTNNVTLQDLEGSVVVRVVSGLAAVTGVTATSTPASNRLALYDGGDATIWKENVATGAKGMVWFADVPLARTPPTTASISLIQQGGRTVKTAATVENQAITFVTADIQ